MALTKRLQSAWNAFRDVTPPSQFLSFNETSYAYSPTAPKLRTGGDRSILNSIYTRIGIDCAAIKIQHVRVDENENYKDVIDSTLNTCLNQSANVDQTGRALMQDVVMSMCDEGVVAIVPVDTSTNPRHTDSYKIYTLRVGKIVEWFPSRVLVHLYNEENGKYEDVLLPKRMVAIVENPLYAIMNAPNSTLKRLIYKLNLLDAIDTQSGSGKLDLIIQLPYIIKSDARRKQAEQRRKDIEMQLAGSKYGIAYTDGTEHITQLNRPVENNLMNQITYLMTTLYSQLGLTEGVFNGTATEQEMLNYHNRTIEPILSAIVDEFNRKFLTETARTQGQRIMFFRDPFKLAPISQIADLGDKLTRNEILTSNEFRAIIGYKPVDSERANSLMNKNLNQDVMPESEQSSEEDEGGY